MALRDHVIYFPTLLTTSRKFRSFESIMSIISLRKSFPTKKNRAKAFSKVPFVSDFPYTLSFNTLLPEFGWYVYDLNVTSIITLIPQMRIPSDPEVVALHTRI